MKTLHPKIHAGILNRRNSKNHLKDLKKNNYENIDLVIVNFYPFEKTLKNIDRIIWFEDLPKWNIAGDTTVRQNPQSNEEKLNLLTNKHEFLDWYNNFKNSNKK